MVTSALVQDSGAAGAVFNLVPLAIVGTLANWFWGARLTTVMFLALAGAQRARSAAVLAFSGVIWALGNYHGMAIIAGGVLGAILATARVDAALTDPTARALQPTERQPASPDGVQIVPLASPRPTMRTAPTVRRTTRAARAVRRGSPQAAACP